MADPTTPDPQSLADISNLGQAAADSIDNLNQKVDGTRGLFVAINDIVRQTNTEFQTNGRLTQNSAAVFGALSTAIVGTRQAFEGLTGTGVNPFMRQFGELQQAILSSPAFKTAQEAAGALGNVLKSLGLPVNEVEDATKKGFNALSSYATAFFQSADNAHMLQNAVIQLSASTGNLNTVYDQSGVNLNNINSLLAVQQDMLDNTRIATGLSIREIEQFYLQLGQVPRALDAVVKGGRDGNQTINLLTAAIQFSTGSGRQFSDVVDDLKTAFRDYNLTGQDALQFTARMGELSNKFGIELEDVRSSLRSTAETFKMFGNEAEGAARLMNQYLGALQSTGISGHVAIDVVRNMTGAMSNLTIAQKSFLSSQTGGPGGLVGGFQIEQMLRQGRIDEVFDRVRQTLTQRTGRITTLQEAADSPAAAQRLERQTLMLMQGPLGQFARTQTEAIRILESFRAREEGRPEAVTAELKPDALQNTMQKGEELQRTTNSILTDILGAIQRTRGIAGVANYGLAQQMFTAGTGTPIEGIDRGAAMRDNLQQSRAVAAQRAGRDAAQLAGRQINEQSGTFAVELVQDYKRLYGQVGTALRAPIGKIEDLLDRGDLSGADRAAQQLYEQDQRRLRQTAGAQVGGAIGAGGRRPVGRNDEVPTGDLTNTTATGKVPNLGEITVHIEGLCIECGEKMRSSAQSYSVNTAQKSRR